MRENILTAGFLDESSSSDRHKRGPPELPQAQVEQVLKPLKEKWKLRLQVKEMPLRGGAGLVSSSHEQGIPRVEA